MRVLAAAAATAATAAVLGMAWSPRSAAAEPEATFTGSVEQDVRTGVPDSDDLFLERNRSTAAVRLEAAPWARVRTVVEGRVSWFHAPARPTVPGLTPYGVTDRFRAEGDAVFLEVARIGGLPARVRAGLQTVRWGSALLLNPTSTVSPPDLEDPLRFGQPLGNGMLVADLQAGPVRAEGVLVPRFRPALLPRLDARDLLRASGDPSARAIADDPAWTVALRADPRIPAAVVSEAQGALRLSGTIPVAHVDAALSWHGGRSAVPVPANADLQVDFAMQELDGRVSLVHPRMQVFGADLAGEVPLGPLGAAGAWVEAAWTVPQPITRTITAGAATRTDRVLAQPYLRFAAGLDHVTGGGTFLAAQWARGFPDEIGADAQGDYAMLVAERPFFRERIRLRAVGVYDVQGASALLSPEVTWKPGDAVSATIAAWIGTGPGDSKFGGPLAGPSMLVTRVRLGF